MANFLWISTHARRPRRFLTSRSAPCPRAARSPCERMPRPDVDAREGRVPELARQQEPLGLVAADAIARGVLGVELVDRRAEEIQPELIALERQPAAARHDHPVRRLGGLAHDEEDALEGASVGRDPVEEERDAGPRLAEGPGGHDVDDRRRRQSGHGPLEERVRRRAGRRCRERGPPARAPPRLPGRAGRGRRSRSRRSAGRSARSRPRAGRARPGPREGTPWGSSARPSTAATARPAWRRPGTRRFAGPRSRPGTGSCGSGG